LVIFTFLNTLAHIDLGHRLLELRPADAAAVEVAKELFGVGLADGLTAAGGPGGGQ
jgi:hypothetical protein